MTMLVHNKKQYTVNKLMLDTIDDDEEKSSELYLLISFHHYL